MKSLLERVKQHWGETEVINTKDIIYDKISQLVKMRLLAIVSSLEAISTTTDDNVFSFMEEMNIDYALSNKDGIYIIFMTLRTNYDEIIALMTSLDKSSVNFRIVIDFTEIDVEVHLTYGDTVHITAELIDPPVNLREPVDFNSADTFEHLFELVKGVTPDEYNLVYSTELGYALNVEHFEQGHVFDICTLDKNGFGFNPILKILYYMDFVRIVPVSNCSFKEIKVNRDEEIQDNILGFNLPATEIVSMLNW